MNVLKKYKIDFWFLVFVLVGYIVASAFAIPFGIENSRIFAVPYRIIVFLWSLLIIIKNYTNKKFFNISVLSLFIFWLLYTIKAYYSFTTDLYTTEFLLKSNELFVRIFLIILIPSLAILTIDFKKLDLVCLAKNIFLILVSILSVNFIYGMFMQKANFEFKFIFSMYYISYGHIGASLSIISLYFLLFNKTAFPKLLLIYGFLLGFITIVVGTARSPILALFIVVGYLMTVKRNKRLLLYCLLLMIIFIISIFLYKKFEFTGIKFADRTYKWIFEGDNSLRTPLFKKALEIFYNKPIIGGRILYEDGFYPHNIFLELLMSTGIFGFIIYYIKFLPVIQKIKSFFKTSNNNTHILFLPFLYNILC